ncbi:flagellar basal-body rod protein FlgG [Halolactibacillus alkaliphilus]|uniref:Flagellar hook protein FlgE n=1 Tax=Halolactibacillus alkaliphilus TaxID=442899 RepID=A0A511WXD8_9BACI|nr:flagellar basal body rod protein FlgG [Halolactibacillus alkaliphilus]GEN55784.1 flagellar basal-body rod protein FlgG [Halolactibacillus alkaliphilus]GGN64957.1 flagellar basal-body rod protein FlgG [Halolactibacillus alkaliphilus]SFO64610.1 flagellar hook protein FlgE [Halolactibacillus alkaliphilus]
MLRSMYSGIAGMKGFQTQLDVVGNNIANVNTVGYKKSRTTFQDMMSQTTSGASEPTNIRGGINAIQVGLGSQLGSIDNIHTQGNRQTTNRVLDMALEGDGMFIFANGVNAPTDPTVLNHPIDLGAVNLEYSRAGNMYLDSNGYIVNANGQYLVGDNNAAGNAGLIRIPENAASFSIQGNGTVNYIDPNGQTQVAGQIRLAKFSNPGGLEKIGGNMFRASVNDGMMSNDVAGLPDLIVPESDGTASIVSGALEMSNVDLAEEFTDMITAQRGFQANTRIITTSDEILQELVNLKR